VTKAFVLESVATEGNLVIHDIALSQAKSEYHISESFTVADEIKAFTTGSYMLELYLSDPHRPTEMRKIVVYDLNIQISEPYKDREDSQFLLVINANTNNEAILAIKKLITSELYLGVDIFNISLAGTFADDETGKSILFKYIGKSIVICGNRCRFFGSAKRYSWDLIDPQDVLFLSMNHTGFLICDVLDAHARKSLEKWTSMLIYPVSHDTHTAGNIVRHQNRQTLLQSLCRESHTDTFDTEKRNQQVLNNNFGILRRIFQGSTDRRLKKDGKTLAKELNSKMPMRRFLVTTIKRPGKTQEPPEDHGDGPSSFIGKIKKRIGDRKKRQHSRKNARSTGIITVAEGQSRSTCCLVSYSPIVDELNTITPQQISMMIASLPFRRLSSIFWNVICSVSLYGVGVEAFYRNLPNLEFSLDYPDSDNEETEGVKMVSYNVGPRTPI
jgi:hypothetical protein